MKPLRGTVWGCALLLLGVSAAPADAAWCNVFQVCWHRHRPAAPAVIKEAGDLLTTLAQKYRSSREAPRALVKLGYLALEPANPKAELDEACARFATAAQVYPDSDAADDAYFGSGICESLRARPARAADNFGRLLDEQPGSPLAAEALFRFGAALSHLDDPAEAMLALQEVRSRVG